jgi:tetratricopeptide (TPR) repeat protein|tara:strand:- start:798 stop:1163 length:366 start_codon:yes stop_codon:yes gene_type:complete
MFKKALRKDKKNFVANYKLGLVYIRNNQRKEGLKSLLVAHEIEPEDIETLLKISEIYLRDDQRLDEAERYIKMALELDNDIPEAHISLGRIYDKKGYDDLAIEQYKIGIKSKMNSKLQALG